MSRYAVSSKLPLSLLPLPPSSHLLSHNLTPDSRTPDPAAFHEGVLRTNPSIQRRARLLEEAAHFTHVTPLPLPFPYHIEVEGEEEDRSKVIERWLAAREPLKEVDVGPTVLKAYSSDNRLKDYQLIGVAKKGLQDCLPTLNVGDAFDYIGVPALSVRTAKSDHNPADGVVNDGEPEPHASTTNGSSCEASEEAKHARQVLTDILAGHTVLINPSEDKGYAPWSLRYSGHQFGTWAGQLGDGRAISILEVQHPDNLNVTYELQLKGAGRTPFSRSADGLAVLRSSIREYLCAEALNGLNIPTTRSLAIILYPNLPVQRESPIPEKAAVVTRVAPSFIRIGNFESLNPPLNMWAFSLTGQQDAHWDALRVLGEWVSQRVLQLNLGPSKVDGKPPAWGRELVLESARRNARMVAGWQAYGFMHGVINTDNVSILGLTIDYGPYAFMDIFNSNHICNHTDVEGRYSYKYQPTMIIYALQALLTSLSPLIGAEQELGHAVPRGFLEEASKENLENWREDGLELKQEVEETVMDTFNAEYLRLMRKRLGLRKEILSDTKRIIDPFLALLDTHQMDFHSSFRALASFQPTSSNEELENFANTLALTSLVTSPEAQELARNDWISWLKTYAQRIEEEQDEWEKGGQWLETRKAELRKSNPRFVLRQWVLEDVIEKVDKDPDSGKRVLAKVLDMASNPFEPWGAEDDKTENELDEEIREERRYCGMGSKKFLGFQCSCSS